MQCTKHLHTKDEISHVVLGLLPLLLEHTRPICKDQAPVYKATSQQEQSIYALSPISGEGLKNLIEEALTRARIMASTCRGAQNGTKSVRISTQDCFFGIPFQSRTSQVQASLQAS